MYDLATAEYEVIFGRLVKGDGISELVENIVGSHKHYRSETSSGRMIDVGSASPSLEDHFRLVPGSNVIDHFYPDGDYGSVRVRTCKWPTQMLNDEQYSPSEHTTAVSLFADVLAERTDGTVRKVR